MKVAMWHGGKAIRIEDLPKPHVKQKEVLIKVKAAGICGADLHAYEGVSKRRVPPLVMGHEFTGEIVEIGENVEHFYKGDRVAVNPLIDCGICVQCSNGRPNICRDFQLIGLHLPGAFAEFVTAPSRNCFKLKKNLSFQEACTVEPLAVGVHAVNLTPICLGDTVVIIGAGVIGLMTLQAAKAAGASRIYVTDLVDYRLRIARKLGADVVINSRKQDPIQRVMKLTEMKGADKVIEAVGIEDTVQHAIKMVKKGGTITVLGVLASTMNLELLTTVVKENIIKGSYAYVPDDVKTALDLIGANKVDVKSMITHVFSLDDIKKGFEILDKKKGEAIKVVITPSAI